MKDDTAPATATEIEQLLQAALEPIKEKMATKTDLNAFAKKDDLNRFATKDDLKNFATKDDLKNFATKDDMQRIEKDLGEMRLEMATKEDIHTLESMMKQESQWVRDRLEWLRQGIDLALDVFGNADEERKSDIKNHEHRIKRLEKKVGLAQMAA